ncbi:MAG: HAD family hydrolase [Pseudomonadota bacterium]|jgi:phosphoserine phosphatase
MGMPIKNYLLSLGSAALIALLQPQALAQNPDPLPSWNEGKTKRSIVEFVEQVTQPNSPKFVPQSERIATFDNDGCLWAEQPAYFQLLFAIDRVKALAPAHPEWREKAPFAALLKGDLNAALAGGERAILEIVMATHAGISTDDFQREVKEWIATAKHPTTGRPYTKMVYQPMLEVLAYLRANGFKTFIVSGGGADFMRPWAEEVYGVPPEQVIGSSIKTKFELRDGVPTLIKLPELNFIDDREGKVIGIHSHIGRRPIAAFGNSDGDLRMLQWVTSGSGSRFALYVHHTDSAREWRYDRDSKVGQLDQGLTEARAKGWSIADMASDWKVIYSQ